MPMIKRQLTVQSNCYGVEVGVRDEYGNWTVFVLDDEERNELLELLRRDTETEIPAPAPSGREFVSTWL